MDMKKYVGFIFLKPDDLREGPIQVTIAGVSEGKYDKPNLDFDDGSRLSLNSTNSRTLSRAYGYESDDWLGKRVELMLGEIEFNGNMQESILIRPISPSAKSSSDMNDDISF